MKQRAFGVRGLLCTLVLVLSACSSLPGMGGTIKIVSSFPLSGGDAAAGKSMALATQQAIQDHGSRSGNYTILYESYDDASNLRNAWDPIVEVANANRAVNDPQVLAYMGTYNSSASKLSIPVLNAGGPLVIVSGANTYVGLTKSIEGVTQADEPERYYPVGVRNYARTVPADDIQGEVDAQWAQELGAKTVYILDDQQSYGAGIANVFEQKARELGIQVLGHEGIDTTATDYSAQAKEIAALNPDLFFFGGVPSSHPGFVWRALQAAGYKGMKMGPDGLFNQAFLTEAGSSAEGTYISFGGLPVEQLDLVSPEGLKWHQEYVTKFGAEPDVYATYAYEATLMVLNAIDKCVANGTVTRACVRDKVFETKDFKGILGATWSVDQNGDTTLRRMTKNQVEDGAFKYIGLAQ